MRKTLILSTLLTFATLAFAQDVHVLNNTPQQPAAIPTQSTQPMAHENHDTQSCNCDTQNTQQEQVLAANNDVRITVIGQGVSPMNTASPAQSYALAKRAAIADAYRMIAEKVKGVRVEGDDLIKNMMVKKSTIRTNVNALVRDASIVETTFKEGLCEVEMEITLSYNQFH